MAGLGLCRWPLQNGAFWTEFLRSLWARRLSGVRFVVSAEHLGLKAAGLMGSARPGALLRWNIRVDRAALLSSFVKTSISSELGSRTCGDVTAAHQLGFAEPGCLLAQVFSVLGEHPRRTSHASVGGTGRVLRRPLPRSADDGRP
jgi:hypothetical protein